MTTRNDTGDGRLLLGAVGWPRPDWESGYFPEDLPVDWQFAYYANEAGCLLLPVDDWQALAPRPLCEWPDDSPEWFRIYLELPAGEQLHRSLGQLEPLDQRLAVLLCPAGCEAPSGHSVLWAQDGRTWVDREGRARLVQWNIAGESPVQLRRRLERLEPTVTAIVVGDADPRQLGELRILAELLGIA